MLASAPRSAYILPELRQELRLHQGPSYANKPTWIIYDPLAHRYFQISRQAFELLSLWRPGPANEFVSEASQTLCWPVQQRDVDELAKFVITNNLAVDPPSGDARAFSRQAQHVRHGGVIAKLIHNYLFFKVPLLRPQRMLTSTLPFVAPFFTRAAAIMIASMGLVGLYLTSRQWDVFVSTFVGYLNFEGALLFACVLAVVKALHELGHAYTAARAGVRVSSMGIAFMLMTPMLYTDVTDAWRLRDRQTKIAIDAAGIVVELSLAAIALFFWAFLPDGPLRSSAFLLATTSLFMGLAINLNPLMRFDGYHILADSWGIANLQARSNALAIWRLRELLFGLGHPPPEDFTPQRQTLLIVYAVAAWLYRMVLFLGIALLVYHAFFKVLGVFLFAVEIFWFILLPIAREITAWWRMRQAIASRQRYIVSGGIFLIALAGLFVPWSGTIQSQSLMIADDHYRITASRPAKIASISIADGQQVVANDVVLTLSAPDIEHNIVQAQLRITSIEARLARIAGNAADRSDRLVLEGELARERENLFGFQKELKRLVITAPLDGIVRDLDPALRPGEWVNETTALARLVGQGAPQAVAYVEEQDTLRLELGAVATFIPDDLLQPSIDGRVIEIAPVGARVLEYFQLASVYGGSVPSDRAPGGEIKPRQGRYLVRIALKAPVMAQSKIGMIRLSGQPESIATAIARRVIQVLIRESSA